MFLNSQDLQSASQSVFDVENMPDKEIINFEDESSSQMKQIKGEEEFVSQRTFKIFAEEQKQHIIQKQKIFFDSPTKFSRNQSFFKEEEEKDFSQYGEQMPDQQFDYQIQAEPAQISKIDCSDLKSPQNDIIEFGMIEQQLSAKKVQFIEKESKLQVETTKEIVTKKSSPSIKSSPQKSSPNKILTQIKLWTCQEILDVRQFLFSPVPQELIGFQMQFKIVRDTSGLGILYPKYHLSLSEKDIYIATAKKLALQKTSKFIFTLKKNETTTKNKQNYVGKLRSNFMGTEFVLYDNGLPPNEAQNESQLRAQLCVIKYESNLLQTRCPKKIQVITPIVQLNQIVEMKPQNKKEGLLQKDKLGLYYEYVSKQPQWNPKIQILIYKGYVLNFSERVNKPSIKNFQLINRDGTQDEIILQFGRYNKEDFNLDIKHPLTPIQAFGICISNFDYKFACE